jgi:hypothetical protein
VRLLILLAALASAAPAAAQPTPGPAIVPDRVTSLFNGKDLSGWSQKNGTATYRVEEGTIVGKTNEGSPNSFLCSEKEYGDFELKFEVKVDDALNSGVQIRSASKADKDNGRVHGPQVEIATNGSAGCVYGEATKFGWLSGPDKLNDQQKTAFKKGEWNKYRVLCKGKSIKTWINDIAIVDFEEDKTEQLKGFLGLQVHGIGKGQGPYEVRWRNISIREVK